MAKKLKKYKLLLKKNDLNIFLSDFFFQIKQKDSQKIIDAFLSIY
jgi:hypothetical protein